MITKEMHDECLVGKAVLCGSRHFAVNSALVKNLRPEILSENQVPKFTPHVPNFIVGNMDTERTTWPQSVMGLPKLRDGRWG